MLMDDSRLTKKVFNFDYYAGENSSWTQEIFAILNDSALHDKFISKSLIDIKVLEEKLLNIFELKWQQEISTKPKLRTYVTFKSSYECEAYVLENLDKLKRSYIAQLRTGILPLRIETGRWNNIDASLRFCQICDMNEVEDEIHFLFRCSEYNDVRSKFISEICKMNNEFKQKNVLEKLKILMSSSNIKQFSVYLAEIISLRKQNLYR